MSELRIEQKGVALWLTLNRESRRNALSDSLLLQLAQAINLAAQSPSTQVIVLTGSGERAFCAGADLAASREGAGPFVATSGGDSTLVSLCKAIDNCPLPIIARVNGHALGGGLGLVCMCDLAIGVADAKYGTPEARVGVWPMVILPYLLRVLPYRKVLELALTAEPWDGERAYHEGLLNQVVQSHDALDSAVLNLVEQISRGSPLANKLGKRSLQAMVDMSHEQALAHAQMAIEKLSKTADAQEGMQAFAEKRAPHWPSAS